jgi:hypothetical protein
MPLDRAPLAPHIAVSRLTGVIEEDTGGSASVDYQHKILLAKDSDKLTEEPQEF